MEAVVKMGSFARKGVQWRKPSRWPSPGLMGSKCCELLLIASHFSGLCDSAEVKCVPDSELAGGQASPVVCCLVMKTYLICGDANGAALAWLDALPF